MTRMSQNSDIMSGHKEPGGQAGSGQDAERRRRADKRAAALRENLKRRKEKSQPKRDEKE